VNHEKIALIDDSWYGKPPGIRQDISAGGVVLHLVNGPPQVALVAEAGFSHYFLPKGRCEEGEDLQAAARREIEEEAGLSELYFLDELGVYERLNYTKKAWKITHYFLFETRQMESHPTDTQHRYQCTWFPLDNLPPLLWPEQAELLEKVRNMFIN
jgi:ADP-ribose pyrophosphatase YjhB (NUDIX family)